MRQHFQRLDFHWLTRSRGIFPMALMLMLTLTSVANAADSLEDLVSRGNIAAEKQDYQAAVSFYEQALKKAPGEAILKKNLSVLYANYGVSLQEKRQYDAALQAMEKGEALVAPGSREAKSITGAKASVYFAQALDIRDSAQEPERPDYPRVRALLEKAIALNPDERAFKKAMAGTYLDEAYQLAVQERYQEAHPLLEKALTYDSQNQSVKQSLANVYLGLAKNDVSNRQQWLDKAIETDNSPKIQQMAAQLAKQGQETAKSGGGFLGAGPREAKAKAPRAIAKLSVADMLKDMETQLQISPPANATLQARLGAVEAQVLGREQSGPLATRTKAAYTALMGSYDAASTEANPELAQDLTFSENSYLDEVFKVTDGKVVRWGKFPLRVYIDEPEDNPLFMPEYKAAVLEGFNVWKERTGGFVNFVEVKNPQAADIEVHWTEQYVDRFADPDTAPTMYSTYTPPKRSKLMTAVQMAAMFTPGYFSLAPQAAAAAMQYQQYKKLEVLRDESKIQLGLAPVKKLESETAQRLLIQNMAAREFGHALGIKASSPQEGDLMYPDLRSDAPQVPSIRDLETLRDLYNRPPNIILNVR